MARYVLKNNAQSELANNPLAIDATELTVKTGEGDHFPSTFPFLITVWDELTSAFVTEDPNAEIMVVTGRDGDVLTVTRAQEGTAAAVHQEHERVAMLITAGILDQMVAGPASATDGHVVLFDSTSGRLIKSGGKTLAEIANVQVDWNEADVNSWAYIKNKPTMTGSNTGDETAETIKTKLGITVLSGENTGDQDLSGLVAKSLFDANTILYATTDNTPVALTVGASTIVGRKSTGGVVALTAAELRAIINVADGANNYTLPTATADTLGGVKIGTGITITDGVISVTAYSLPTASDTVLGGVKVGANLSIDGNGVLSASAAYSLPTASDTVLGGIKVGANLSIDGNGVLSANAGAYTLPTASDTVLGGVKIGARLTITDGVLSADVQSGEGSMVYPGAGIPLSTGSAWGTSITDNSANWNTAYGWGNHASAGYVTGTPWTAMGYLTSLTGAVLTDQSTPQTIGLTGSRLAKLWATDITVTNAIVGSVTGNAGSVTGLSVTAGKTLTVQDNVTITGALGTAAYTAATAYATAAQGATADAAVPKSLFDANSILYATTDNTPVALTVGASTIVGRKASGGIVALTATELRAIINVADGATANAAASVAEQNAGTENAKFITPDVYAGSTAGKRVLTIKVDDEATGLITGDGQFIFPVPEELNGMNLVAAHAFVTTVSSSGTPTIQIRNVTDSADMLSTRITIDANENTSYTAAAAPVIDGAHDDVATGDLLAIDVDVAGTGAYGMGVVLTFQLP